MLVALAGKLCSCVCSCVCVRAHVPITCRLLGFLPSRAYPARPSVAQVGLLLGFARALVGGLDAAEIPPGPEARRLARTHVVSATGGAGFPSHMAARGLLLGQLWPRSLGVATFGAHIQLGFVAVYVGCHIAPSGVIDALLSCRPSSRNLCRVSLGHGHGMPLAAYTAGTNRHANVARAVLGGGRRVAGSRRLFVPFRDRRRHNTFTLEELSHPTRPFRSADVARVMRSGSFGGVANV